MDRRCALCFRAASGLGPARRGPAVTPCGSSWRGLPSRPSKCGGVRGRGGGGGARKWGQEPQHSFEQWSPKKKAKLALLVDSCSKLRRGTGGGGGHRVSWVLGGGGRGSVSQQRRKWQIGGGGGGGRLAIEGRAGLPVGTSGLMDLCVLCGRAPLVGGGGGCHKGSVSVCGLVIPVVVQTVGESGFNG